MAKSSEIQAVLIRCGRTDWDDQGRIQGRTDLPLSEPGHQAASAMAQELVTALGGDGPAAVYVGSDEASRQTGELIAGYSGASLKSLPDLSPLDLGIWEGLLESQMEERFPSAYRQWRTDPATVMPPEGESFEDADTRLRLALCRILEKANGRPVVFVLRPLAFGAAVCWLTGRATSSLWQILDDGPQVQSLRLTRDFVKAAREGMRAPT